MQSELDELKGGFPVAAEEYKKVYVITKMHPSDQEYQQQFSRMQDRMDDIKGNLFSLSTNMESSIKKMNDGLEGVNQQIRDAKKRNRELKAKLGLNDSHGDTAKELYSDSKELYNMAYLRNWALAINIVLGCVAISKL